MVKKQGEKDSSLGLYTFLLSLWKQVMTPLCDLRLVLIIPLIAFSGLQQAFLGVGGAMVVYGVFDAICSLVVGLFTSGLTSITLIVSGGAFLQGVYMLLIAAIWGIGNRVLMSHLNALLAMLLKQNMVININCI
ncbi:hypothetical protein Hanom_Chr17g01559211 [Helianthus anomalus]